MCISLLQAIPETSEEAEPKAFNDTHPLSAKFNETFKVEASDHVQAHEVLERVRARVRASGGFVRSTRCLRAVLDDSRVCDAGDFASDETALA